MLKLDDLTHLPQVEGLIAQIAAGGPGLVVVAGLDPRTAVLPRGEAGLLPSGRATILRILAGELLDAYPETRCLVVGEDRDVLHVARRFRNRIEQVHIKPPLTYADALAAAHAAGRPRPAAAQGQTDLGLTHF